MDYLLMVLRFYFVAHLTDLLSLCTYFTKLALVYYH